jgi:hypothetical protein
MNVLRIPPFPLSISYTVPDPNEAYYMVIKDKDRNDIEDEITLTSNANSVITYTLPEWFSNYDESYALEVYTTLLGDPDEVVIEDNLNIERPYVNPNTLGTTATEIAEYTEYEFLARAIIDSIVPFGFYYTTYWLETTGQNTDYLPLWLKTYKILEVYENTELVYDYSQDPAALGDWNYLLTKDKTAIIKDPVQPIDAINYLASNPVGVDLATSDSFEIYDTQDSGNTFALKPGVTFPMDVDYLMKLEVGYKVVPYDIQQATKMLINDIKCGKLEYFKRGIVNYSTDQYRMQIDKSFLDGTGNLIVDKILDKYITNVNKPGVL